LRRCAVDFLKYATSKGVKIFYIPNRTKDYRVALLMGDNLGDFTDVAKGSVAERAALFVNPFSLAKGARL